MKEKKSNDRSSSSRLTEKIPTFNPSVVAWFPEGSRMIGIMLVEKETKSTLLGEEMIAREEMARDKDTAIEDTDQSREKAKRVE